jgi:hypothetical protein
LGYHSDTLNNTLAYHLGCDYFRDKNGILSSGSRKYISKMMGDFEILYGYMPQKYTSPVENGDHPDIYTAAELDVNVIEMHHTMIGCLQWAVPLGRFEM